MRNQSHNYLTTATAPARRSPRAAALVGVTVAIVALAFALAGCAPKTQADVIEPQITDGALANAGTLTVGLNLDVAPYAAKSGSEYVGTDAEYAAELARLLGLKVKFVSVAPDQMAGALAEGTVDVVMSAPVALADSPLPNSVETTVVAPYITAGSAIYAQAGAQATSVTLTDADLPVAAQKGSPAYWTAIHRYGAEGVKSFDSAAEALQAVADGEVTYAVLDSVVGSYAITQAVAVSQVGWLSDPAERGIAIVADKTQIVTAVSRVAEELRSAGWTDALLRRWLMVSSPQDESTSDGTGSAPATSAP